MGDMKTVEAGGEIVDVLALLFLLCLRLLATTGRQDLGSVGVKLTWWICFPLLVDGEQGTGWV